MDNPQNILVKNYSVAPDLLVYKLYQVFATLDTPEKIAVYNDIMADIKTIIGGNIERLCEDVARLIIQAGKEDLQKEKKI
jgi:hypothetical protein